MSDKKTLSAEDFVKYGKDDKELTFKSDSPPKEEAEKQDFEIWEFGHLIRECNRCGHKTIMDRDVEDGIRMYLPTTDKHELRLSCENCGASIRMYFVKSDKKKPPKQPDEDKSKDELVVEEKKTKRKKGKKSEATKDSKKAKSVETDSQSS